QPGGVVRAGYALWALDAMGWPRDETTSGVAHYLGVSQRPNGNWSTQARRAPSESSDFTATALALRSIEIFGEQTPKATGEREDKAGGDRHSSSPAKPGRVGALKWLEKTDPSETEDRVFRVWGLKSAGASSLVLTAAANDLVRTQRPD